MSNEVNELVLALFFWPIIVAGIISIDFNVGLKSTPFILYGIIIWQKMQTQPIKIDDRYIIVKTLEL